jgi:hypothetical protein
MTLPLPCVQKNYYTTITDIITMDNDEIDGMNYENASVVTAVSCVHKNTLKFYYKYEISHDASDWLTVTSHSVADFHSNVVHKLMHGVPACVTTSQSLYSASSSAIVTSSQFFSFDALHRCNLKGYVKFKRKGSCTSVVFINSLPKQESTMFLVCLIWKQLFH